MVVSEGDHGWVQENYPGLTFALTAEGEELAGEFRFDAAWDDQNKTYLISPNTPEGDHLIRIQDRYNVRIVIPKDGSKPKLFDTDKRIVARATQLGVPPENLHVYSTGEVCPVGEFDMDRIENLPQLLDVFLQFFYDQSYHERYGRWPRGQYLHGLLGMIENFHEQDHGFEMNAKLALAKVFDKQRTDEGVLVVQKLLRNKQRVQGHWPCLCGSGKPLRSCHKNLFLGLWSLQDYLRKSN